ncbi:MAG: hypothetical protein NTV56_04335 [Alphaproteobacteria bacterium]|nr:hypothetical protein [Alphaproteobacteria bacterium]
MRTLLRTTLLICSIAALAIPAAAQDSSPKSSPLPEHLPLKVEACFGRSYDAEHLARHPKQRVTRFHLFRDFSRDTNAEDPPMSLGEFKDSDGENDNVALSAYVRFRDKPGVYSNWLSCHRYERFVRCGVDCDGGGFKLRESGKSLSLENEGFVVIGGCGATYDEQENSEHVRPGTDDRTFQLDLQPLAACIAERDAMKPVWASLGPPIRERLNRDDAVCFARSYDAAHLAKNPKQTVRRIAVLKAKGVKPEAGSFPVYGLTFRIERKDGKKFVKSTNCQPSKYSYACTHDPKFDEAQDFFLTRAGDKDILLRDRKGKLSDLFAAKLGTEDRIFKLSAQPASACDF